MTKWWWLSFCDGQRPRGSQLLGVCVVQGDGLMGAIQEAHRLGCNPGGEVLGTPIRKGEWLPKKKWRGRLLTRAQAEEADEQGPTLVIDARPDPPIKTAVVNPTWEVRLRDEEDEP